MVKLKVMVIARDQSAYLLLYEYDKAVNEFRSGRSINLVFIRTKKKMEYARYENNDKSTTKYIPAEMLSRHHSINKVD